MESPDTLIQRNRISLDDIDSTFNAWLVPVILFPSCIIGFLTVIKKHTLYFDDIILVTLFGIGLLISCYLVYLIQKKSKLVFLQTDSPINIKEGIINKTKLTKGWKEKKQVENYFLFYENNYLDQSYYVTIIITKEGFYINYYPFQNRVLDLGLSNDRTEELVEGIKSLLKK